MESSHKVITNSALFCTIVETLSSSTIIELKTKSSSCQQCIFQLSFHDVSNNYFLLWVAESALYLLEVRGCRVRVASWRHRYLSKAAAAGSWSAAAFFGSSPLSLDACCHFCSATFRLISSQHGAQHPLSHSLLCFAAAKVLHRARPDHLRLRQLSQPPPPKHF